MNRPKLFTLPNAITLCSLNLGAFATLRAVRPDASGLRDAALAILAAALCDGLDGRVARALKEANALGAELDSLADLVSFGIAPAALAQGWALSRCGGVGLAASAAVFVGAARRLARFNLGAAAGPSSHFEGLPTLGAAVTLSAACLADISTGAPHPPTLLVLALAPILGLAMISTLRFPTFKLGMPAGPLVALAIVASAAGLAGGPALALLAGLALYLASPLLDTRRSSSCSSSLPQAAASDTPHGPLFEPDGS